MSSSPVIRAAVIGAAASALPAGAAELQLNVEIPKLDVAEYHRPYVAAWLERADGQAFAGHLAVWYDQKKPNAGGTKWLNELRQWWRKGGRALSVPADGITGATRAPGQQAINLSAAPAIAALPAGRYEVVVEAARESGGREVLRLPLQWPPAKADEQRVKGEHELGAVSLVAKP
ncbi:DUF2271 domain-containing protein [Derxia gummosa]|uniref:DUF2271 domain-containing protein n=1 Tax=Derxia gummosa DSM 723 TaxID=1121388 RepID=A0A8B6X7P6_9BURK|nr:DUF2271 domain-containing protein [Derxia gummosa]